MTRKKVYMTILVAVASVIAYIFLIPLLFMIFTSFKPLAESMASSALLPQTWTLENYLSVLADSVNSPIFRWMFNTGLITLLATLAVVAVDCLAAYALARFQFKGRSAVRLSFLLTNAFPKMGIYTAMAVIFYKINLIGTFAGVVLVHIVNTMMLMVWIPSGSFRTVHIQQEESARDVGAGPIRTFFMVTLPMAKPGIIVAALYTFLGSMEEAQGSLLIGLPNVHTMPSELYGIIMSFPDTAGSVFAMILLVPSILLLILFRKYLSADALSNGLKM